MTCPSCKAKDTGDQRFCTVCGIILRKDVVHLKAPTQGIKSTAKLRLLAVGVAGVVGAFAGYELMALTGQQGGIRQVGGFFGLVLGAGLMFVVSGFRVLYYQNLYKVRLASLNGQINHHLEKAYERYHSSVEGARKEKVEPPVQAIEGLAVSHLLKDEIQESLETFHQLEDRKDELQPEQLNNVGVALARAGRNRHAYESFEQAETGANGTTQIHVNMIHYLASSHVGSSQQNLSRAKEKIEALIQKNREEAEYHNRKGTIGLREERYQDAINSFQEALSSSKGDKHAMANARNNIGLAKFSSGDVKAAIQEFVQAQKLDPGHARALANHGVSLIELDNVKEGLSTLQRAAELDDKSALVISNLGFVLCLSGAVNDGIHALRKAEQLDPGAFEPVYNLGKAYADFGINDVAARYLDRATQIRPQSWQTALALGVVLMHQHRFIEARKPLAQAAELAPHSADALASYGLCLAHTLNYELGEKYVKMAIGLRKDSASLYSLLAWVQCQQEAYALASDNLAVALSLDPKDPIVNDNYGLIQLDLKAFDSAMRHFKEVQRLRSSYKRVHYHIGYTHALMKKVDLAIGEWEKTVEHERGFTDAFVNLGVAYYLVERLDDAVTQFRRVLTMRQDRMEDFSNLAMALAKQGVALRKSCRDPNDLENPKVRQARDKFNQAVGMFDKALQLAPNNVILHSNRGLACFFGGRVEEAMHEWSAVSSLDAEYASRRGHLMQTVFDEAAVQFVSMKIFERVSEHPLTTAEYTYALVPSYDIDQWQLVLEDEDLKPIPNWSAEAGRIERNLRALKQ